MTASSLNSGKKVYLVNGKRTPFGKFGGSLKKIAPVDLAVKSSKSLIDSLEIKPEQVDHVIFANVAPSTTDTMYGGRHLALKLDMPQETPGYVVNRLCGSGIQIILDAVRQIKLGESECVLAAGSENMSLMPHLIYGSRFGTKYGSLETVDMLMDTLTDKFTGIPMALTAEKLAENNSISREAVDEYSYHSHLKAIEAYNKGYFNDEIVTIEEGRIKCEKDEHIRFDVDQNAFIGLKPSFKKDGVVTPGTASGIVDGAATVLIASEYFVKENNLQPLCEILDGHVVGVDPSIMGIGPVPAINHLLEKNNLKIDDIDLVEINEAFSAQVMACGQDLKLNFDNLNVWGGAVAIGHPLGATGTRISLTLARQLNVLDKEIGIASACIGGGQGISLLLKRV